jgi:exosortase D (VPLPA-CTERM-specific)
MQTIKPSHHNWLQIAAACALIATFGLVFRWTFVFLYANWQRDEYSYGIVVPVISAFLIWRRRALLADGTLRGSWWGVGVVAAGLLIYLLGLSASILGVDAYALVIVVTGCVVAAIGWPGLRLIWGPIALLLLMVPLPTFWYNNLSSQLQLLSSQLGVALIRFAGIIVSLEGNVIDLGSYKLQVAEACSGLRYLFPLMTLGVLVAYLFRGKTWARWTIVLSTLPISVLMNSFRIGVIGLLVDRFGKSQAEGFIHQFEGWAIFMACLGILLIECLVLLRLSGDRRGLAEALRWDPPPPKDVARSRFGLSKPAIGAGVVLLLSVYPALAVPQRAEVRPSRTDFSRFPLRLGDWIGHRGSIDSVYLRELKLDDYLMADYMPADQSAGESRTLPVNVYVAYYASQRSGQSVHSPRSCLPGGGWRIESLEQHDVAGVNPRGMSLRVNRAIIQQGAQRQLVYYWFQERGRDLTNEYLVKWYLFADAVVDNRSDGALVRLITPLREGEDAAVGDSRLGQLSAALLPVLGKYVGG